MFKMITSNITLVILLVSNITTGAILYRAGFNSAENKNIKENQKVFERLNNEIEQEYITTNKQIERERDQALLLVNELRKEPPRIKREVITKVIEGSNCKRLGVEYQRLYNSAIDSYTTAKGSK